jgi:hypothetical protein
MSKAKKWFRETSFWQIFITYSVGSWIVLGHVDLLTDRFGVPDWVFNLSLALSLLGLIGVVLVAAALKREVPLRRLLKVGLSYLVLGFVFLQALDLLAPMVRLPGWAATGAVVFLLLVFPISMSLALLWPLRQESRAGERDGEGASVPS